ncbi:hypothetical protein VHEMI04075 [[Torrubiella] hemipterigena]|uniref:Uncharacterized protein n=1 Tax=[Torrubiella] hemipterigena TaxID=1531966 RepID=A0A0A1TFD0_9HYPO|nr:hypothetical protein VHEMI04075 [[Torrubiella] hemipterigena]
MGRDNQDRGGSKVGKLKRVEGALHSVPFLESHQDRGHRAKQDDFERFTTLMLPSEIMGRREPSLAGPLAEYRPTGKSEKLLQYIDSNWRINNTLIDYDFANRSREQGDGDQLQLDVHPLK